MNLNFETININGYKSNCQKARKITELWVEENLYCPCCGNEKLIHFPNNMPVADFFCPACKEQFELKSINGIFGKKVNDGAYETMIRRITSNENPNFLFMGYSKELMRVENLTFVPNHFFVPEIIEKRKPLKDTARRAGWVGCNIMVSNIPSQGIVKIVDESVIIPKSIVISRVNKIDLLEKKDINSRGWLMDVLNCVNSLKNESFTLHEMYDFEELLKQKHPNNNNVKAKIRQQLQYLRDKGFISFESRGHYVKIM